MWVLRIHTGQQKGQTVALKPGRNTIGRGADCDIVINSSNVSKLHAEINLQGHELTITDLKSRNGTFVDGLKIKTTNVTPGQKITLHNILLDVIESAVPSIQSNPNPSSQNFSQTQSQVYSGNTALNMEADSYPSPHQPQAEYKLIDEEQVVPQQGISGIVDLIKNYFENVVMPGIYKIPENLEFKWTLSLFVGLFIVFVTVLSSIPLMRILKGSIEAESRQRALTIAKTEALINRGAIQNGIHSTLSIAFSSREPGVVESYIIDSTDGSVLAPSSKAGSFPNIEFIHLARKQGISEGIKQINSSNIVAVVGIPVYNASTGKNSNKAYSVILYDMGNLAVDNNKTISLFVQTLFIALVVGSLLFFFLYKVILHPVVNVNKQLDDALKDSHGEVKSPYQFPELQDLISNINSTLVRAYSSNESSENSDSFSSVDRTQEMENIVQVVGFPCFVIQATDKTVAALNTAFEEATNHTSADLLYGPIDNILDQALKLSVEDLLAQLEANPQIMHSNQLDINGEPYDIAAHAVWGQSEAAYYVITLLPGGAA